MGAEGPSFTRVLESRLYVLPRTAQDVGWCGYLLGRLGKPPADPITIGESFNDYTGSYLFALTAPLLPDEAAADAFIAAVRSYLDRSFGSGQAFNGQACVWIPDPSTPDFGPSRSYAFSFGFGASAPLLYTNFNNLLGPGLTLAAPQGVGLGLHDTGLVLYGQAGANLGLITSPGGRAPTIDPNKAQLPFVGQYSGCFVFAGKLKPTAVLPYFEAGLRYLYPNTSGTPECQIYPILDQEANGVFPYAGAIDPLDPVNARAGADLPAGRLRTLFAPTSSGSPATPPRLASWLRTTPGHAIELVPVGGADDAGRPVAGAGALVFEYSAAAGGGQSTAIYMTYAGDWAMAVDGVPLSGPGAGATQPLLVGLSGLERIAFRAYALDAAYDRLRFVPRNAAYAPDFPFADTSLEHPATSGDLLDATYRTSWLTVASDDGTPVLYTAQPAASPLFAPAQSTPLQVALDWTGPGIPMAQTPGFAFPAVPYAGVAQAPLVFPSGKVAEFETQVLAPSRKRAIAPSALAHLRAARLDPKSPTPATTPQGFLVDLEGPSYRRITLARSTSSPDFAFVDPDAELQSLFQTNQLFAVIASPAHVGAMPGGPPPSPGGATFANSVDIAGWTMTADVGNGSTASDYRNVVVLKFTDDTLLERVANPSTWTDTADFSVLPGFGEPDTALAGLSQWLQELVGYAIDQSAQGNALYANFARIATDRSWRGVLVLQAEIAVEGLPEQIRGLAAGIDFEQFLAHHFGFTVTPVTAVDGTLEISAPSSLFGLIDYQLPQFRQNVAAGGDPALPLPLPTSGPYGFSVLQLQALFVNSALVDFRSRIQVTAAELFGSPATAAYGGGGEMPATAVVLRGNYQRQGDQSTYVFEQDATTVFALDSNVLEAVAMQRVQFNTLTPDTGDGEIRSRFLIWGTLAFAQLTVGGDEPFDVLSFGGAPGTAPAQLTKGLSFSNLAIDLASASATPTAVSFAFTPAGLAFDLATSTARAHSLFPTFTLQLDSFIAAAAGRRPSDYGYLTVSLGAALEALDGPWFGVVYKITLGGPGALVAQAGFESRLLLAWSPQTAAGGSMYAVFAGLQLPGASPGAKTLSLQGVLKLSIGQLRLLYGSVAGGAADAFTLRMSNVGLTFLGFVKLPPGATINFFLFGDPAGTGSLGWYAAYVASPGTQQSLTPVAALASGDMEVGG